jgi:hypothetical protein
LPTYPIISKTPLAIQKITKMAYNHEKIKNVFLNTKTIKVCFHTTNKNYFHKNLKNNNNKNENKRTTTNKKQKTPPKSSPPNTTYQN